MVTVEQVERKIVEKLTGPGVFTVKELREDLGIPADDRENVAKLNYVFRLRKKGLLKTTGGFDRHRRYQLGESKAATKWLETMKTASPPRPADAASRSLPAGSGAGRFVSIEQRLAKLEDAVAQCRAALQPIMDQVADLHGEWFGAGKGNGVERER